VNYLLTSWIVFLIVTAGMGAGYYAANQRWGFMVFWLVLLLVNCWSLFTLGKTTEVEKRLVILKQGGYRG